MRAEDRPAPDVAVVRDVHVCHEQIVISDRRLAAATSRTSVDRDELAEDIAAPDPQRRRLTLVFQILWRQPDRGHREDLGFVPDVGATIDDGRGADPALLADANLGTDHGVRDR